jgi:Amt family ammonium transporter
VTAGCASVDAVGAIIIGVVSGILVDLIVELLDQKLHIDDPVGAVAVHGANGIWGTIAVGLFAENEKYGGLGLFYGGGFHQLGVQLLGVACIAAYTVVCMIIVFRLIDKTIGLRVTAAEEVEGLDVNEHGLANAYADFLPLAPSIAAESTGSVDLSDLDVVPLEVVASTGTQHKYTRVSIVCNQDRFGTLKDTMAQIGVTGMTVSNVMGCGTQKGKSGQYRGLETTMNLLPKIKVDIVVSKVDPALVVAAAKRALYTGNVGDGKIFLYDVEDVVRVRTGEQGYDALQSD